MGTFDREDRKLCHCFGIQSEVKIVLVKLQIKINPRTATDFLNLGRNISSEALEITSEQNNTKKRTKTVNCSVCNYSTWKASRLTAHMIATHKREIKLKCTYADCSSSSKIFSSKGNLVQHMKNHEKSISKKFSFSFCLQQFLSNHQLIAHMWKHTGEKPFYCKMCKQGFTSQTSKIKHETTHCKLRLSTSDCNQSKDNSVDKYWSNWRKDRYLLKCDNCEYFTTCKHEFEKHVVTHTGEPLFACSKCPRKFSTTRSLSRHTRLHSETKPFKCPHCEFRSFQSAKILRHVASMHNVVHRRKNFQCLTCGKSYFTKDSLQHHSKAHSINRPYYACTFCQHKYTENFLKTGHEKRCTLNPNRTTEKRFKCGSCNYASITNAKLERHLMTHTGEKPFACTLCPYKCCDKYVLNRHIRRHTGEKNYNCKYCESSFAASGNLNAHMRTHTGEKPFKCRECDFSTATQGYLKDHLLRHKGSKPFACKDCNYRSVTMADVRRHMKSMHK